uniref:Uncharacterized protein n=1 Tax=Helicotheca tamesis TaxID=374047 RepID=A0A7S2N0Q4_9STRA
MRPNSNIAARHNGHQRIQRIELLLAVALVFLTALPINGESLSVAVEGSVEGAKTVTASPAEGSLKSIDDDGVEYGEESGENNDELSQQTAQQQHPCHWGNPECHHRDAASGGENRSAAHVRHSVPTAHVTQDSQSGREHQAQAPDTIESVIKKAAALSGDAAAAESVHSPPEGFSLAARVLTDHDTGLSYFAPLSSPSDLQIPFLECGAVGSTTEPIEIKHGTFRHFPSGADPSAFSTSPHPQLVVALHPLQLTVSGHGEESRVFLPGDVILLEDTMGKGHKMRALSSAGSCAADSGLGEERDLSVFMLTLPHHHHHHHHHQHHSQQQEKAKISHHLSVFGLTSKQKNKDARPKPCDNEYDPAYSANPRNRNDINGGAMGFANSPFEKMSLRRKLLGVLGAGVTLGSAFWLAEVAPFIPVCFGATCVVVGGTCATAFCGEKLLEVYEISKEKKMFSTSDTEETE